MTRQVINIVEDMAADEGVRHFHTFSRNTEGQIILDTDLLPEVGEDIFTHSAEIPRVRLS